MRTVTLTEFRSKASSMLTEVERGETLIVVRYGRRSRVSRRSTIYQVVNRRGNARLSGCRQKAEGYPARF
jgi:antitoxin (DNA-binding transcriptional repressor) of toxin-antitoxin stability system